MSIGYRWNITPTSQVRCVAEYNHIYDVMKTLADGGRIYTLGLQPGTVLRGNLIHDVHRSAYVHGGAPNNGFFIDGSMGFRFESNVVHRTSGDSVRFNQCEREGHTGNGNAFDRACRRFGHVDLCRFHTAELDSETLPTWDLLRRAKEAGRWGSSP